METNAIYAKFLSDEPRGTSRAGQLAPDQAAGFPPEEPGGAAREAGRITVMVVWCIGWRTDAGVGL